jgi:voltage-gated potassium channel
MPHTPHTLVSRFEQEMHLLQRRSRWRRFRAAWRDTWVLLREFRGALLFFLTILAAGAISFMVLWNGSQTRSMGFFEAFYDVLTMTFFQPILDFPEQWYLDVYFFIMPVLGMIALARGVADFVALLFNRHLRQTQWEEAVASTFNNHIIIIGLGHLGLRVVRELILLDEDIVVIEAKADSPRFDELRPFDIPIIVGDGRNAEMLNKAGLERASALIICTNDDLMNLQIASRVREINTDIRLVMRMFDDQFARSMADRFGISAVMSASALAAPAFAGSAAGTEIVQTFTVEDNTLVMGRIEVQPGSRLDGMTVCDIEQLLDLSIIIHHSPNGIDIHPAPEVCLRAGDVVTVITSPLQIKQLASHWNRLGVNAHR